MVHVYEAPDDEPDDIEATETKNPVVQQDIYSYRFVAGIILAGESGEEDRVVEHEVEFTKEAADGFQWMAEQTGLSSIEEVYDVLVRFMASENEYEKERFTNAAILEKVTILREFLNPANTEGDWEELGPWSTDYYFNKDRIWESDAEEE